MRSVVTRTDSLGTNGPTWGEVGSAVSGAAGAAADKYSDIAKDQVEALKDGWKAIGGSKRLDNAKGLFRKG